MDMAVREWLTIIIILLIAGILLDGLRRMRQSRRNNIRMSLSMHTGVQKDELESHYGSELPSGGARVKYRNENDAAQLNETVKQSYSASKRTSGAKTDQIPEQVTLNLEESVPMLMELDEQEAQHQAQSDENDIRREPHFNESEMNFNELSAELSSVEPESVELDPDFYDSQNQGAQYNDSQDQGFENQGFENQSFEHQGAGKHHSEQYASDLHGSSCDNTDCDDTNDDNMDYSGSDSHDPDRCQSELDHARYTDELNSVGPAYLSESVQESVSAARSDQRMTEKTADSGAEQAEEVLVINVMAPAGQYFEGSALLENILASGMRFGAMNIFHCHEDNLGEGEVLFSMANIVVPGTFDLQAMSSFYTPGVSFFMTLPLQSDSLKAFDRMTKAARQLSSVLNGELKDENRSVMTQQTIEHCRQRIQEFERKRLSRV